MVFDLPTQLELDARKPCPTTEDGMSELGNIKFGVCDTCLKFPCQCAKPTGALTREQLEASCREYERLLEQKRATIEQQAQEMAAMTERVRQLEVANKYFAISEEALAGKLAAMTTERDDYKRGLSMSQDECFKLATSCRSFKQQLATTKAQTVTLANVLRGMDILYSREVDEILDDVLADERGT